MLGHTGDAGIVGARLVIVRQIFVIGLLRRSALGASSALTIPGSLLGSNPLDRYVLADAPRTTRIERAWIVVIAIRLAGTDRHRIGRRRAVLIERARSCLRDDARKQQGNGERGENSRAGLHGRLVRERRLLRCANYDSAMRSLACLVAHATRAVIAQAFCVAVTHLSILQFARRHAAGSIANLRATHIACVGVGVPRHNIRACAHTIEIASRADRTARVGRTANPIDAVSRGAFAGEHANGTIAFLHETCRRRRAVIAGDAVGGSGTHRLACRRIAQIRRAIRRPIAHAHIRSIARTGVCLGRARARLRHASRAQRVFLTGPRTIALTCLHAGRHGVHHALHVGILSRGNRLAQAVGLRRFHARARLTRARTRGVAANVIHAETAGALVCPRARGPIGQFRRAIHVVTIIPGGTLAVDGTRGLAH